MLIEIQLDNVSVSMVIIFRMDDVFLKDNVLVFLYGMVFNVLVLLLRLKILLLVDALIVILQVE